MKKVCFLVSTLFSVYRNDIGNTRKERKIFEKREVT